VAGSCEYGDEPSGIGAMELVIALIEFLLCTELQLDFINVPQKCSTTQKIQDSLTL
jgi:hypothetical protein